MNAAPKDARRPTLTILNTHLEGRRFTLHDAVTTLGRGLECEIMLDQNSVSRQHARIEEVDGRFFVEDLGSRNGVKLGERRITRTEFHYGEVVTIGEIQVRLDPPGTPAGATPPPPPRAAQAPATRAAPTRAMTGTDIIAAAQSAAVPGVASELEPPDTQQEREPQIGLNLKLAAAVIVALVLSVVAGVLILKVRGHRGPSGPLRKTLLIRVGEKRWDEIHRYGDFSETNVVIGDDDVVDAARYDDSELLITGKSGGETNVTVHPYRGRAIVYRVIVRGRMPDSLESLSFARLSPQQRRRRARILVRRGLPIQDELPYTALQHYQRAVALLKPLEGERGELYLRARKLMTAVETTVDTRWEKLDGDTLVAIKNKNWTRAAELLDEALYLIPEPNDPRHQEAQWGKRTLLKRELNLKARKTKRGRR